MNKNFTDLSLKNYLRFIFPTIFSMVFISIYTMTDGIFVSNKLGSTALAALNITLPAFNFMFGSIFMIVIGSSAIIGIKLGGEKYDEANEKFSNMIYALIGLSIIYVILGIFCTESLVKFLGAKGEMVLYATQYLRILLIGAFAFVIKLFTEVFLRLEGKFGLSLFATIIGGVLNMFLDYLFIYKLKMGISGAGYGTIIGAFINGLFGVIYFYSKNSKLTFKGVPIDFPFLKSAMINGSSEMVSSLSNGITTLIFNLVLMNMIGKLGVSAISIVLYINFLLSSVYIGISAGIQPLVSFNYGAGNRDNIFKILRISLSIIGVISILSFLTCNIFKYSLISLFEKENVQLIEMTAEAFKIFSFTFLINGLNILSSGLFTALNNGKYSAIISFTRSIIFKIALVIVLPRFLGLNGVWMATPLAECLCLGITIYFFRKVVKSDLSISDTENHNLKIV